ncbi:hypothetical protein CHS0354_024212 [Potamilus streckersoni]|uniref:Torsin-1A C-terminal domain-containing protein n=1 Tax=Potamilus streckersoni TaxID=2493646 RepID=A0AAE0RYL3_9BIVA|nr:hypothetical protein CHS0354_024212 [Potamilus streckersoni]
MKMSDEESMEISYNGGGFSPRNESPMATETEWEKFSRSSDYVSCSFSFTNVRTDDAWTGTELTPSAETSETLSVCQFSNCTANAGASSTVPTGASAGKWKTLKFGNLSCEAIIKGNIRSLTDGKTTNRRNSVDPNQSKEHKKLKKRHTIHGTQCTDFYNQDFYANRRKSQKFEKHQQCIDEPSSKRQKVEKENSSPYMLYILTIICANIMAVYFVLNFQTDNSRPCYMPSVQIDQLRRNLTNYVFGQHIATNLIVSMLKNYSVKSGDGQAHISLPSSLVLSFHGWTGVGKNFVSKFIVQSFPYSSVFWYLVPHHFAHDSQSKEHKENVITWLTGNMTKCGVNIFIFDEMDKATIGVHEGIHYVLSELKSDGKSAYYSQSFNFFILLSNSKANQINHYFFSQMFLGRDRLSIQLEEFHDVFLKNFEIEWYSEYLKIGLIDRFVPFLPLDETHVRHCVERELQQHGLQAQNNNFIDHILKELSFFEPGGKNVKFSLTGCKRVPDKVHLYT